MWNKEVEMAELQFKSQSKQQRQTVLKPIQTKLKTTRSICYLPFK